MAEAALGYARAEFEDEVKKLRKENAELKAARQNKTNKIH